MSKFNQIKVLVTGGAGFIGSAIVPKLMGEGYDVYVLDNLSFGMREFINIDDAHFIKGDILERDWLIKKVAEMKPSIIIHLAAIHFIPYCNQNPLETTRVNIEGTINLLDAITKNGLNLNKIIFASTAAVYPITNYATNEDHDTGPMDVYGITKLAGERIVKSFYYDTKIKTVICRFFNAFGPNETNAHLIPEIDRQLKSGKRTIDLGNLEPKRDFIHTEDMANAILAILNCKVLNDFEIFNLGQGVEYSVREVVEAFERQLGEKITIEVDPQRVRKVERMHLLADIQKLKRIAGWEPKRTLDEGIKNLING